MKFSLNISNGDSQLRELLGVVCLDGVNDHTFPGVTSMQAISDFICDSDSGRANITVNASVYSLEAIHAATYKYTGSYHVLINPNADASVTVIFEAKDMPKDINQDLKDFANSIMDHQVRLQLDRANGKIRDLIVAHAFSPLDLKKEIESL